LGQWASQILPGTMLYDEAKKDNWTIISIKNDWKRIFAFD